MVLGVQTDVAKFFCANHSNDKESVGCRVVMDKECFDNLVRGYQEMWAKLLPGDECGPLNLVRNILKEIERGCSE
jgi:hypothetical protein